MRFPKTLIIAGASAALLAGAVVGPSAIAAVGGSRRQARGASRVHDRRHRVRHPVSVPPGGHGFAIVDCPRKVMGGGGRTSEFDIYFTDSYPGDSNTWFVRGTNLGSTTQTLTAWAVCK